MKIPVVPPYSAVGSHQISITDDSTITVIINILTGLERQKEELGPIADELIELFRHLGVGKPPLQDQLINPSSE